MSKYKVENLIFIVLIGIAIYLVYSKQIPFYLILILLFFHSIIIALGAYFIQFNFFVKSFNKGINSTKSISLTFDDGPHENTLKVIEVLKKYDIKASFFLIGKNIKGKEDILKKIIDDGHLVGNHSYKHDFWYSIKSVKNLVADIHQNNAAISSITGLIPNWFRPPYGVTNPRIANAIKATNMKSIGWSIRSYDTVGADTNATLNRICKQINGADIVLMHDHLDTTAQLLEDLILYCKKEKIEILPLDKMINIKPYA
jgi:peptidoglycan/xylan/chitin deacetylase (PgdA/CDA1 family)